MKNAFSYVIILIGGLIAAYGLEAILIPNRVSDGGVTGLGIVASQLTNVPLAVFLVLGNLPFIYLGYKQIGTTFAVKSAVGIASLSGGSILLQNVDRIIHNDTLLITVFGGICLGIGMGLAIRNGGAIDGIDMLAVLISRKTPFSTGDIILTLNVFVFITVGFVFGLKGALLSGISYYVAKTVIETIEVGFENSKAVRVITSKPDELTNVIQNRLGRSVTLSKATGGFAKSELTVVYCVINQLEENKMKNLIAEVDKDAFYTLNNVAEVNGGNFKKKDIH